jgi:hypothetical protein
MAETVRQMLQNRIVDATGNSDFDILVPPDPKFGD